MKITNQLHGQTLNSIYQIIPTYFHSNSVIVNMLRKRHFLRFVVFLLSISVLMTVEVEAIEKNKNVGHMILDFSR